MMPIYRPEHCPQKDLGNTSGLSDTASNTSLSPYPTDPKESGSLMGGGGLRPQRRLGEVSRLRSGRTHPGCQRPWG